MLPCNRRGRIPLGWSLLFLLVISLASMTLPVHAASSDLTIESIWLEDASQPGQPINQVSPGQSFLIVATMKNIGQETASGYYIDVYYDSDYGRGGPDNIAPGEVQTWYVGPLTAQAGTHTTKWVVDPDSQMVESDETNNQKELAFTIGSQTTTTSTTTSNSASTSITETTVTTTTSTTTTSSTSTATTSSLVSVSITVAANPAGSIIVDGTTYISSQTFAWVLGSSHTIAANSPVLAGQGIQYVWTSWVDGGDQSRTITVPTSATTYTANYQTQYQVTYSQTGCSIPVSLPASEWVSMGASSVGVFPGTVVSSDGKTQCVLQTANDAGPINAPTVRAGTYKTQWQVTFAANPSGAGAITVNGQPSGTAWYDDGAALSIQATGNTGYAFSSWNTDTTSITFADPLAQSTTVTTHGAGTIVGGFHLLDTTPPAVVTLLSSDGKGLSGAVVQYYSGGWKSFGTTASDGTAKMALVAGTYSFQITYAGASQQKSQNVGTNPNVVFQTTLVTVKLLSSTNTELSGTAQYYAGGWKTFGSGTSTSMELLPLTYSFQISYAGVSQQKSQDVSKDPNMKFQTVLVTMKLLSSAGNELNGGAQYYGGGWKTFGSGTTTSSMELLPLTYTFQVSYAGASQQVSQNAATNANVIFKTVQVHSDSGKCTSYHASGWRTFTQDMELLPGSYTFRFSDKTKDTSYTLVVGALKHIH